MTTINALYGVDPTPHMLADKYYKDGPTPLSSPDLVVGLELEIENWEGENRFRGFSFKEDHSLRGSAIEAVTAPTKARFVENLLRGFFTKNEITERNYSERTGTHVHMNVSDLTLDQVASFCLLYQVFERTLFKYVGVDRDNNIFCVPWEQAGINYDMITHLRTRPKELTRAWRKYTALNICPITSFGSLEFRHLPGTCDIKYILGWINLIGCMHQFAINNNYAELQKRVIDLNTSSAYPQFAADVFGLYTQTLDLKSLQEDMETGVLNVKLMSITDLNAKKKPVAPASMKTIRQGDLMWVDDVENFADEVVAVPGAGWVHDAAAVARQGVVAPNPLDRFVARQGVRENPALAREIQRAGERLAARQAEFIRQQDELVRRGEVNPVQLNNLNRNRGNV